MLSRFSTALRNSAPFAPLRYLFRPPQSSIFNSLIFIALQIPFPATRLFSHLYKTTGCRTHFTYKKETNHDPAIR